ncbi:hypothetical protein D3C87_1680750 [compost metagenome]
MILEVAHFSDSLHDISPFVHRTNDYRESILVVILSTPFSEVTRLCVNQLMTKFNLLTNRQDTPVDEAEAITATGVRLQAATRTGTIADALSRETIHEVLNDSLVEAAQHGLGEFSG